MTPDDVYTLVSRNFRVLFWLILGATIFVSVLIVVQIIVKFIVFGRFWKQLRRLDGLLKLAEVHGEITDAQAARMRAIAHDEFKHLLDVKDRVSVVDHKVTEVKQVVDKTAPLVMAMAEVEHPSGTGLSRPVDPANPPKRRAEDKKP